MMLGALVFVLSRIVLACTWLINVARPSTRRERVVIHLPGERITLTPDGVTRELLREAL